MVKQTVILRKRAVPKVVNLPNGRSFTSRWEGISRKQFPIKVKVKKQWAIDPRRNNRMIYLNQAAPALRKIIRRRNETINRLMPIYDRINQSGSGLATNLLQKSIELGSRAVGSEFCKRLINKGIDNIFKFGVSKINNKNMKRAVESEIANMVVDEAVKRTKNKYENLFD